MYNSELKIKFINDQYDRRDSVKKLAEQVLNLFEDYERGWGADLCTKTTQELQPIVDEVFGLRVKSHWAAMSILREYARWCISMKVPGACDGALKIEAVGLDKVRRQLVSSPFHLQKCMDEIFVAEAAETIAVTYRCYYWMAFAGMKEEDALQVTCSDVDFSKMEIVWNGAEYPIYREALPAFHAAAELSSFLVQHPLYKRDVRHDRVPGDNLLRGMKSDNSAYTIRVAVSRLSTKALSEGRTSAQLSFKRVQTSGLFYRMYERECAGVPMDFSAAAEAFMAGKEYQLDKKMTLRGLQNRIAKSYTEDYLRWKAAFGR
jgi:hypothetical protein